jgi:hypothetical protein
MAPANNLRDNPGGQRQPNAGAAPASASTPPASASTPPVDAPAPADANEVAQLKQELAELRNLLMKTIQTVPKVSPDTIWAKNHEREMEIKEDLDRKAAYFEQTCDARTQWEANKLNPEGKRLYKVKVGWAPEVIVRANDEVMARAYYEKVCHIRSVQTNFNKPATTEYSIIDVTDDPVAQKIVASNWQYTPANAA